MARDWYFDRFCGLQVAVCAEDGRIVEVEYEKEGGGEVTGNIYKGRVANVVSGIQAAFVSCGMEKNCYLPLNERNARFNSYDGETASQTRVCKEGDELLVQIVKPAMGTKGAKVTADLAFVGRTLIYLPQTEFLGISRKITDPTAREALLKEADKLRGKGEGFIIRTAGEHSPKKYFKAEAEFLRKIYKNVLENAKNAPVGKLVYREFDLSLKIIRDSLGGGDRVFVGDGELYNHIVKHIKMSKELNGVKVVRYTGERAMLDYYGIAEQVNALASPRVSLANGGDLVINRTEAMTVIDVNTGKYTGDADLESTVFETDLQAAREIARQVCLRNIGGIIAVDFIDLQDPAHRVLVQQELQKALSADRTKTQVYDMNELCVALFTRKRTKNDLLSVLMKPCPHCTGEGQMYSDLYYAVQLRARIMDYFADDYESVIIELNAELMKRLLFGRYFTEDARGAWLGKRVYFIPHADWREEKYTLRGDNDKVLSVPDNAQILY